MDHQPNQPCVMIVIQLYPIYIITKNIIVKLIPLINQNHVTVVLKIKNHLLICSKIERN
jgi:hypothetical protein